MALLPQYGTLNEKQIEGEKDACKIVLLQISEQNNDCKNKLSDLVTAIFSSNLLEQAENFLTRFLHIDSIITILENELMQLEEYLLVSQRIDIKLSQELLFKIKRAEQNFYTLKSQFSDFLMGVA